MLSFGHHLRISLTTLTVIGMTIGFSQSLPAIADTKLLSNGAFCEGKFDKAGNSPDAVCTLPPVANQDPNCTVSTRRNTQVGLNRYVGVFGNPYTYYRGPIVKLVPQGRGAFVWYCRDGSSNSDRFDRYEGDVRNGRPNGRGSYLFAGGARYDGLFRNGRFHGRGVLQFGKSVYSGEFINGDFSGKGSLTYENGESYVGTFRGGYPHGKGTLKFSNRVFSGEFYQGQINGRGTVTNEDGSKCTGQFFNGLLEGRGTCTFPRGSRYRTYTGEFKNGRPDGQGRSTLANGTTQVGLFRNGEYVGR